MAKGTQSGSGRTGNARGAADETSFVTRLPIGRGSILNNIYRIERQLGVGGMGEVYEAINVEDGEREAIKIISTSLAEQEKVEALFRREAKTLRKLSAPEIAQLRFFARDPDMDVLYLVTEFVDGPPLSSLLTGNPASVADVRTLLRRVGKGLKAAHDLGLIHRDISPDNILLPDGKVANAKIIDFGIAKDVTNKGTTIIGDSFVGKLSYASPEVFAFGKSEVGPWSDIYSLGLVGAAFALGEPLNMGQSFPAAMAARQTKIDLGDIPGSLQHVLDRMLDPDWTTRMQSIDEMLIALEPTATIMAPPSPPPPPAFEPVAAPPPPPPPPVPEPVAAPPPPVPAYQPQQFVEEPPPKRMGIGKILMIVAAVLVVLGLVVPGLFTWLAGPATPIGGANLSEEMTAEDKTNDPATWQTLYAVREVAVRNKPVAATAAPIAKLSRGSALRGAIVPGAKDPTKPWLLVKEGPHKGRYVSAINLTKAKPPEIDTSSAADMIMSGPAEVRAGPFATASALPEASGRLSAGDAVQIVGTVNTDWAEVTLKSGGVGYVLWSDITSADDGTGAQEAQQSATFNPSFDCEPVTSYVLITICQSETLSRKDRQLSATFKALLAGAEAYARAPLLTNQRRLLTLRDACGDADCIEQWYDARIEEYGAQ